VSLHFDTLVQVHEEKYERSQDRLRPACRRAVDKFLARGILDHGFARVRYELRLRFTCRDP
jgi:hypothetical protein